MFGFFKRKKNHDKSVEEKDQSVQQSEQIESQESSDAVSFPGQKPTAPEASRDEPPADVALHSEEEASFPEPSLHATDEQSADVPHELADDASFGADTQHPVVPQLKPEFGSSQPEENGVASEDFHSSESSATPSLSVETGDEQERPQVTVQPKQAADAESDSSRNVTVPDEGRSSSPVASSQENIDQPRPSIEQASAASQEDELDGNGPKASRGGFFSRIRSGLSKTRNNFTGGLATLFLGKKEIDDELIEDLETQLLVADVGVEATTQIIDSLSERVSRKELSSADALYKALQEELGNMLKPVEKPLVLPPKGQGPFVILVIGVNGVGKTTTIGKLARRYKSEGRSVMLAAGDTFRAAAVEQLKVWGERNDVPVVAQHTGADSASVIYDALSSARSRKIDVLIADTAGRLHNKSHLMEELKKVQRVMAKLDPNAPHEVMLVLDAGTGQNAISQAETFGDAIPVTGIALTKLDGTAKGGVIFALAKQLGIPIRYIGVGESLEDLRPFEAAPFTEALFDQRSN